jgi:uncharacterized membrane protein YphA (DoxX/SURF4 family)
MAVTGLEGVALLAARVFFGGVLAFMGLNHFLRTGGMVQYAEHKGLPAPRLAVLASGAVLVLGGSTIVLGVLPLVGAAVVAAFLLGSAVLMHDFWAVPEDQREDELTQFLKNAALAGGAIAFAAIAGQTWALSVGVGL